MLDTRRARTAWLYGARAFHRNDPQTAAAQFDRAVSFDDGMADAWLGLHAVGSNQDTALGAMVAHEDRFGDERARNNMSLDSRYVIGPFATHTLRDRGDLWCAAAAGHLDRNEYRLADLAVARTSPQAGYGQYLRGRLAFATGGTDAAISWFRHVIETGDPYLAASARLLSGIALAEAGAVGPAKHHLTWILRADFVRPAHVSAHYWLGRIARAEGDEQTAMTHFHYAYAQDPALPGLKEAMDQHKPAVRVVVARPGAPQTEAEAGRTGPGREPAESVEEVLAELAGQRGQDGVKQQVRSLMAQTRAQIARSEHGLPQARLTRHFVFTGPPGTGKTTIARIIARLYRALGVLEGGQVIEVDRSGLIGEHLGETAAKTTQKLDEAMGGVLFIDEAYALVMEGLSGGDAFGQEAVDTLLKRMEDERDRFVVIAAGYPEPMERFLSSNPGLKSRFTTTIEFTPYSAGDLVQIAGQMAAAAGDQLTDAARAALALGLNRLQARGDFDAADFGNARYVRTLLEKAAEARDLRLFGDTSPPPGREAMILITDADILAAGGGFG